MGAHGDKQGAAPTLSGATDSTPCARSSTTDPTVRRATAVMLRPGNGGSNTAADRIRGRDALNNSPHIAGDQARAPGADPYRRGRLHPRVPRLDRRPAIVVLGRVHPARRLRRQARVDPDTVWAPAYDAVGRVRDSAWVADVTGLLNLSRWPSGMRVIVRKERPHPGAQLWITDVDGHRATAFATNTARGQLADLELGHRRRARAEDRIRCAKDTGLRNLPLHDLGQNQIWCAIVALACELTTWMQLLAFTDTDGTTHQARRWEPKRRRLRLFSTAARLARTSRQVIVHHARNGAWTTLLHAGLARIRTLTAPG
ncbi:transposase [Kribbella steppae]|nr:transposase [Kribbella steppae]